MCWWYTVHLNRFPVKVFNSTRQQRMHFAAAWLCDELVQLWRLACLNPELRVTHRTTSPPSTTHACRPPSNASGSPNTGLWLRRQLARRLRAFHRFAVEQARRRLMHLVTRRALVGSGAANNSPQQSASTSTTSATGTATSANLPCTPNKQTGGVAANLSDLIDSLFSTSNKLEFRGFKPALVACKCVLFYS
ncbi:unnamed protein product [Protopolystoma xenopodis]|uniref:ZSWIM8 TPR repeats domain-containing protein n=1 Tax=Protopolystoma xenopodis TaxID=117903 RepID=A0A3S5CQ65_9PLAT|nr:unnamed protein product [Protopolystoma xenopodis]